MDSVDVPPSYPPPPPPKRPIRPQITLQIPAATTPISILPMTPRGHGGHGPVYFTPRFPKPPGTPGSHISDPHGHPYYNPFAHMYHNKASEFMFKQFEGFKDFTMNTAKSGLSAGEKSAFWFYNKLRILSKRWFTHFFLTLCLMLYSVMGAAIFMALEDSTRGYRHRCSSYTHRERASSVEEIMDSDDSNSQHEIRSTVHIADVYHDALPTAAPTATGQTTDHIPSTSQQVDNNLIPTSINLPVDILDVLGESKEKPEVFGPKIQEEISKRWGRILCEGLNKEQKKALGEKIYVPENFQLAKAPKLNPEIAAVLVDSTRNRDKRLEGAQNYLGLGISALTALTSTLIEGDMEKIDIVKKLSETNQILLDLHFENTINRRKLITYTLDKKFQDIVQDVKRDTLLFGENLTDKIKASKSAERSGLQIKKTNLAEPSTSKKPANRQGNWRGPPRSAQRGNRQGGTRNQTAYRSSTWKRPTQAPQQYQDRAKERSKTHPQTKSR